MKTELKPCPFCGGTELLVERLDNTACYVQCESTVAPGIACICRGPVGVQDSDDEDIPGRAAAIRAWNQRSIARECAMLPAEAELIERKRAKEIGELKHDIERHIANHSADLSATSSTEAAEPRQTIGGVPVIEVEKVTITLEEYETLLRDVRAAPAASAEPPTSTECRIFEYSSRVCERGTKSCDVEHAPAASAGPTEAQIVAAARTLSNHSGDVCGVNREDNWAIYSEDFLKSAKLALEAALNVSTNPASVTTSEQGGHGVNMSTDGSST